MTDITPIDALNIDVSASMVAVVSLVTVIVFGLAVLARPSRATITWGAAFGLGMLGTYLWLGGHEVDSPALKAAGSALMVSFEPIIWLGLRMHLRKRPIWWPVIAFVIAAPTVLAITAGTETFQITFRVIFLVAGVFAALIAYELFRMTRAVRDIALPLALVSCAFVVVAVVGAVTALSDVGLTAEEQLDVLRGVNGVGTLVTSTCAAFTIVLLVRADMPAAAVEEGATARARRRLLKAKAQNDQAWAVLDVRLDDQGDLIEAYSRADFASILQRFHDDVLDALPVSADAQRVEGGRSVVIVHGSDEAIEHHIRTLLTAVSVIHTDGPAASVRVSASIGWASVASLGYDYEVLVTAAADAAVEAREDGGDRWKRADERRAALGGRPASAPEMPTTLEQ